MAAATVAIIHTHENSGKDTLPTIPFYFGRSECSTSPVVRGQSIDHVLGWSFISKLCKKFPVLKVTTQNIGPKIGISEVTLKVTKHHEFNPHQTLYHLQFLYYHPLWNRLINNVLQMALHLVV
eukprot:395353_1